MPYAVREHVQGERIPRIWDAPGLTKEEAIEEARHWRQRGNKSAVAVRIDQRGSVVEVFAEADE